LGKLSLFLLAGAKRQSKPPSFCWSL